MADAPTPPPATPTPAPTPGPAQPAPTVTPAPPMGMITLKGDLASLTPALQAAIGLDVPAQRRITLADGRGVAWMAPDELLLLTPPEATARTLAALTEATAGSFATAADVSSARAAFRLTGPRADETVMKLAPVDLARLEPGEIRRTRAAQIAVALWRDGDGLTVLCFRSVADYLAEALSTAAHPAAAVHP